VRRWNSNRFGWAFDDPPSQLFSARCAQNESSHRIHSASFIENPIFAILNPVIDIGWTESPMPTASETLALLVTQEGAEPLAVEPGAYYVAYEQARQNVQHPADSEPSAEQQHTDD
jgi:hypothetical protein